MMWKSLIGQQKGKGNVPYISIASISIVLDQDWASTLFRWAYKLNSSTTTRQWFFSGLRHANWVRLLGLTTGLQRRWIRDEEEEEDPESKRMEKRKNPLAWLNLVASEPYYLFHFLAFFSYFVVRCSASQVLSSHILDRLFHRVSAISYGEYLLVGFSDIRLPLNRTGLWYSIFFFFKFCRRFKRFWRSPCWLSLRYLSPDPNLSVWYWKKLKRISIEIGIPVLRKCNIEKPFDYGVIWIEFIFLNSYRMKLIYVRFTDFTSIPDDVSVTPYAWRNGNEMWK